MAKRFLTIILIVALATFFLYSPVIFQEGNPLPLFGGMMRLAFNKEKIVKLSSPRITYMTKSKGGREEFLKFMQANNYLFAEQMGAGYILISPSQERITVVHRQYSRYYDLWKFPDNQ